MFSKIIKTNMNGSLSESVTFLLASNFSNCPTNSICSRPPEKGALGGGGQMPPYDFSIAKAALFDFTNRGKFLPKST